MKYFVTIMIVIVASGAAVICGADGAAAASTPPVDETGGLDAAGYKALTEDIEIMRRIIEKNLGRHLLTQKELNIQFFEGSIDKKKGKEDASAAGGGSAEVAEGSDDAAGILEASYDSGWAEGLPALGYSQGGFLRTTSFNSRGFYIPGSGVVFSLDVCVPVREVKVEGEDEEESFEDVWKETERELLSGSESAAATLRMEKERSWVLDEKAIDGVIDLLLKTVARHVRNIENLDRSDRITLLVDFRGTRPLDRVAAFSGDTALALYGAWAAMGSQKPAEDAIIQIPVSILHSFEATGDLSVVKSSALIKRFPAREESTGRPEPFYRR